MLPTETIPRFDAFLAERGLVLEAIVVGGTALSLLGITPRETRDCDILEPDLSRELLEASKAFAAWNQVLGEHLADDWLNNGPASLAPLLPDGWRNRLQLIHQGPAVRLWSLGRPDLLLTKLFAFCDRNVDLGDCLALRPSPEELEKSLEWTMAQDLNPDWPAHVRFQFQDLARRLGHEL